MQNDSYKFLSFPEILICFPSLRLSLASTWGILSRNTTSTTIEVLQPFGLRSVDPTCLLLPKKKNRAGEWTAGYGAGVKGFQTPGDVVKIYDWKSFRNTIPTLLFKYGCLIRYFVHMIFSWQGTGHFKTCWKWPILVPQKNNGTPKRVVIQKGSNIHNTSSQRL